MNPDSSDVRANRKQPPVALRFFHRPVVRYLVAVVMVGLACLLRFGFSDIFGSRFTFITFLPAVMLAALLCGFGPGLLATGLSALVVVIWVLPPVGYFAISDTSDAVGLAMFVCIGIFMSAVARLYHQASAKVAGYEQEQSGRASLQAAAVAAPGAFQPSAPPLTFKKSLTFDSVLALILAILVSVGWLAYRDMKAATEADRWETHTYLVINEQHHLIFSLKDAEAGQRGFIITGDQEYLKPYRASLNEIELHLAALRRLTADNPHQQQRLAAITPLVAAKLAELQETIALRQTKGYQAASEAVITHLGRNIMDKLNALVIQSNEEEEQLLQDRTAAKDSNTDKTIRSILLGGTLGGLVLLMLFISLKLELARRRRAEAELRAYQGRLTELVDVRTQELRREKEVLRLRSTALQSAANGIAITRRDGSIEWVNDAFTRLTGFSAAEAIGQNPRVLKSGQHPDTFYEGMWATVVAGHVWHGELVNKRKDGTLYHEEMTITPVRGDSGDITHFIAIKQDITERIQAEEKLRRLNRTLRALSDSNRALLLAQAETQLLKDICRIIANECGHAMVWIGYAEDDPAKTVRPVASAGFEEGYLETLRITWADTELGRGPTGTAIRSGQPSLCADMLTDPKFAPWRAEARKRGYASSLVLPLLDNGKVFGAVTIYSRLPAGFSEDEVKLLGALAGDLAHGITTIRLRKARQQAEAEIRHLNTALEERVRQRTAELEAANRELEAFCYSIAHDLRAPLRSIDGFSLAVLQDYGPKLDAEGQSYLGFVRTGCQQMGHLIDDLLKLSRVTRAPVQHEPVNFTALAHSIAGELQRLDPGRVVHFRITDGLTTEGDPHLLEAALRNLIENAWKFTGKQAEALIEVGVMEQRNRTAAGSAPVFFVRDNGVGFDMAYADKLFTPFQRLHSKTEYPGTGIGLATVQRIFQRHGGRIWAEAAVGQGATFHFTLNQTRNQKGQSA